MCWRLAFGKWSRYIKVSKSFISISIQLNWIFSSSYHICYTKVIVSYFLSNFKFVCWSRITPPWSLLTFWYIGISGNFFKRNLNSYANHECSTSCWDTKKLVCLISNRPWIWHNAFALQQYTWMRNFNIGRSHITSKVDGLK